MRVGHVDLGGDSVVVIAGPCSVESREQIFEAARLVAGHGAAMLRGGAFKPRSSPYAFQGLGAQALTWLKEAGRSAGLPVVTEVMAAEHVGLVAAHADVLQVGARNMQNFSLLRALGSANRPILLKRGASSTTEELLLAAEYVLVSGNPQVVLCERGIRTFETVTRNTLDLGAVAALKQMTHLPVLVDPSHAAGRANLVGPLARAGIAAGADGLLVEVHPRPAEALSDGAQSLDPAGFSMLMDDLRAASAILGRSFGVAGRPESPAANVSGNRRRIDRLDQALVALLNERASLALELGRTKAHFNWPIRSPERELVVLERVAGFASRQLGADAARRIFSTIIAETAGAQQREREVTP